MSFQSRVFDFAHIIAADAIRFHRSLNLYGMGAQKKFGEGHRGPSPNDSFQLFYGVVTVTVLDQTEFNAPLKARTR